MVLKPFPSFLASQKRGTWCGEPKQEHLGEFIIRIEVLELQELDYLRAC
jgi:hypothetical protein